MMEKFKSLFSNDQIYYGVMVILVGVISFGLGRMSTGEISPQKEKPSIQVIEPITLTAATPNTQPKTTATPAAPKDQNQFVASKNGTRYYLSTCSGVSRIKPENIISFESREAAEAAGFTKAANCPGL